LQFDKLSAEVAEAGLVTFAFERGTKYLRYIPLVTTGVPELTIGGVRESRLASDSETAALCSFESVWLRDRPWLSATLDPFVILINEHGSTLP